MTLHEELAAECARVGMIQIYKLSHDVSCPLATWPGNSYECICEPSQSLRPLTTLLGALEARLCNGGSDAVIAWARAIVKTLDVSPERFPETLVIAAVPMTQEQRAEAAIAASRALRNEP